MKEIEITCQGTEYVKLEDLVNFQGNLKELANEDYLRLKRLIIRYGFSFPVIIWGKNIIDGHQRIFTVWQMIEDGYCIGPIPSLSIFFRHESGSRHGTMFFCFGFPHL